MVEAVEAMGGGRLAIQFDGVDANYFDEALDQVGAPPEETLALLRLVTTPRRLARLLGETTPLLPGDWVSLTLSDLGEGPPIWSLGLRNGQLGTATEDREFTPMPRRRRLASLMRLPRADRKAPQPLSSSVPSELADAFELSTRLRSNFDLNLSPEITTPNYVNYWFRTFFKNRTKSLIVEAHHVGQASFNVLHCSINLDPLVYFDVGRPIWINIFDFPKRFSPPIHKNAVVIISHWDTDHFAYGMQNAAFRNLQWVAPCQIIGPLAFRFASLLLSSGNLTLIGQGHTNRQRHGLRVIRCAGSDINNGGIALHVKTKVREILLVGDAKYECVPGISKMQLSSVQLSHHGGRMGSSSIVPNPADTPGTAIVSYGLKNRYGHPNSLTIKKHKSVGWTVLSTVKHRNTNGTVKY